MTDTKQVLPGILSQAQAADLSAIRSFLTTNPSEPLVATGSGGSESASDSAALNFSDGDRNEARKLFIKAGSDKSFTIPMPRTHKVSCQRALRSHTSPSVRYTVWTLPTRRIPAESTNESLCGSLSWPR